MKYILISFLLFSQFAVANNYLDENLKTMNWNGIEVIWLEDDSLPTYDVSIYFKEGALGDKKGLYGQTELMFAQLSSGTHRYTQKEIVESLEFFGAGYGSHVTHEYSTYSVSGLVKDFIPTMKMVCHLFDDATFPKKELKKTKRRIISGMKTIITSHPKLANHIFRYESLKGTGFEMPTTGKLKTIKRLGQKNLLNRLKHFNNAVQKRIYIKGPKQTKALKSIVINDCKWKGVKDVFTIPVVSKIPQSGKIIFIPVPNANQAQVRVGRTLMTSEVRAKQEELKAFTANFMGGGFTSRLVQRLRVEKGLTYSAGSYASEQKNYGRSGISTFTKNETIVELLNSIKEVITESSTAIKESNFNISKKNLKGNYLLGLESTSDFLQNLLYFDHIERKYSEIYDFSDNVNKLKVTDLQKMVDQIYGWDKQTVLVLGDKSLIKKLQKAGYKVLVKKYKDYL